MLQQVEYKINHTDLSDNDYGFKEFNLWKPRDVVGGDFFWLNNKEIGLVWLLLIVQDTDSGAFMTMISITILDRIASSNELNQPSEIMNNLDQILESTLN